MGPGSRALVFVVVLAGTASAGDNAARTERAKVLHQEGLKQYNLGNFAASLEAFRAGYLERPAPEFLFNIGQAYRQLGQFKEALHAYRRFLGERPETPNRADVAQFIALCEAEHNRKSAALPRTNTVAPKEQAPSKEAPAVNVAAVRRAEPIPPQGGGSSGKPMYRRWWLWTAVAGVLAIGAGVGVGVGLGARPGDAEIPTTELGAKMVTF